MPETDSLTQDSNIRTFDVRTSDGTLASVLAVFFKGLNVNIHNNDALAFTGITDELLQTIQRYTLIF